MSEEFCKHGMHESQYCGSCNHDTIKTLQSKLERAKEVLKEFALGESQFMDGVECMHKAREALKELENG